MPYNYDIISNEVNSLKYTTVLFDLDGTLIRSGPAIFAAARLMMADMGIDDLPDEIMCRLVGPPLSVGFKEVLNMPEDKISGAIELYAQKARIVGLEPMKPYEGIKSLLSELRKAGIRTGVVTSKMQPTAREHIEHFGLLDGLDYICGALERGRGTKTDLLLRAMRELDPLGSAVMVGDRLYDINAANDVGLESIGVLYGYGSKEELEACYPTHIVKSVEELRSLILT